LKEKTLRGCPNEEEMDIPVMLTPSPVILTPIRDDGLREL